MSGGVQKVGEPSMWTVALLPGEMGEYKRRKEREKRRLWVKYGGAVGDGSRGGGNQDPEHGWNRWDRRDRLVVIL